MNVHHLAVPKTARYATLGDEVPAPAEVWFVFHGYRQLAPRFLSYFEHLANGKRLLVAPEGQSRFYVDPGQGKVGASWMTREDREIDIQDYLAYLNQVAERVFAKVNRDAVEVTVLGFSQGVATGTRWACGSAIQPDRVVLWGDTLPPDLGTPESVRVLRAAELFVVRGLADEYIPDEVAERHLEQIRNLDLAFDYLTFDGGHRLDKETLARIAGQ